MQLQDYQRACAKLQQERAHALRCLAEESARKLTCRQALDDARRAQDVIQAAALATQQAVHDGVAGVVTRCLQATFGGEYAFEILFERKRNRTEARMVLTRGDGAVPVDPLDASGGGVVDLISFALRLACLMLAKPPVRKLLVLDEPMRHLSKNYRPAVAELLTQLAEETGIQFIIVTHDQEFEVGKVIHIGERE